ncbi:ABC transporter permease [Niallia sp. JL1B1071]|uniref:ABC transporter permease n=1 Tax=Niallia tiangongensis TaxID=3237105 RepID=UPI0037DC003A
MKQLYNVVSTELLKSRKSKVMWIISLAFTILPIMAGFFMFVLKDPVFAQKAGLLGAKAQLAGTADWQSYLNLLAQGIAIGGLFVFGFMFSWIFGREYTERTVKDLLALPFSRTYIPIAKFITVVIWSFLVSIWVIGFGFVIGHFIGLEQWSTGVLEHGLYVLVITSLLTILVSTPVALFACYGKGYLAPLGFVIITIIFAQIISTVGYGSFFPWAVPALFSNILADTPLEGRSFLLLIFTGIIGILSTLGYWRFADQNG